MRTRDALIGLVLVALAVPSAARATTSGTGTPKPAATHHAVARHVRKAPRTAALARPAPAPPKRGGLDAAPIPDRDVQAPVIRAEDAPAASPTLFELKNEYRGDGYIYGSSPQGFDDRRTVTVPGVNFSIPLR